MTKTDGDIRAMFRTRTLPVPGTLAGYAWLIERFDLRTILPNRIHVVATVNKELQTEDCVVHPVGRRPADEVYDHLRFAIRYDGVNLLVLSQVFASMGPSVLQAAIDAQPTSGYARRLCYLYEWLTEDRLDVPAGIGGQYADVVDGKHQYAAAYPNAIRRWRVHDNLPGTRAFCPLVGRTARLDRRLEGGLAARAAAFVQDVPAEVLRRAAAFLLLNDSKASFEIERERPSKDRAERWARVIARAGETPLSVATLIDLQRDLIEDDRFVKLGLREEGGFVGTRASLGEPRPDHVSAPHGDVPSLLEGIVSYDRRTAKTAYDPVLAAAAVAFGFVYIHPFEDGNGRLHRYLIHHVLAHRAYLPAGIVVPVSVAILDDLTGYRHSLESLSRPMLTVIDWRATERGNVEVLNDVADFYRFFDATRHAEYLYDCLEAAIDTMLPDELRFLSARDAFHRAGARIVDMPERMLDLMFRMLRDQGGRFSKRMLESEFAALTEDEVAAFERAFGAASEAADAV